MTAAPPRPPLRSVVPSPRPPVEAPSLPAPRDRPVDPAVPQQRRVRLAAALCAARLRLAVVPHHAVRRRQRVQVCSAARILTVLGLRVSVRQPAVPWPRRSGQLMVVGGAAGWLGELALLTAVPRTTEGWSLVADRLLRPRGGATPLSPPPTGVACPVEVRFLSPDGHLVGAPRTLTEVLTHRGLVVEVHLLPPVQPETELAPAA